MNTLFNSFKFHYLLIFLAITFGNNLSAQCYSLTYYDSFIDGAETCQLTVSVNGTIVSGPTLVSSNGITTPLTTVAGDVITVEYTVVGDAYVSGDNSITLFMNSSTVATYTAFAGGDVGTDIITYVVPEDCACSEVVADGYNIAASNPGVAAAGHTSGSWNQGFQPLTGSHHTWMNIHSNWVGQIFIDRLTPAALCGSETLDLSVWFSELNFDQTINIKVNVYDGNMNLLTTSDFDVSAWTEFTASVTSPTGDVFFEVLNNTVGINSAAGNDLIMDDMSILQCDCESLLPVTMKTASCDCKLDSPEINFEVVSESNNDHFIISTSTNGVDFAVYTTISSIGDHGDMHLYSTEFPDYDFDYYSIAQVDMDGTRTELGIFNNECDDELNMHVLPNPNNGVFTITINKEISQAEFYVYDSAGRIVYFKELDSSISQVNISDIADGIYNVVLKMNNKILNKKVVIEQ